MSLKINFLQKVISKASSNIWKSSASFCNLRCFTGVVPIFLSLMGWIHHVKNSELQTATFSLIITQVKWNTRGNVSFLIFLPMYITFNLERQFTQSFNLYCFLCCCQLKFLLLLIVVVDSELAQIHLEQPVTNNQRARTLPFMCDTHVRKTNQTLCACCAKLDSVHSSPYEKCEKYHSSTCQKHEAWNHVT